MNTEERFVLIEDAMINGQKGQALEYLNECHDKVDMLDSISVTDIEMAFSLSKVLIKELLK
jgi:hypothetical protein